MLVVAAGSWTGNRTNEGSDVRSLTCDTREFCSILLGPGNNPTRLNVCSSRTSQREGSVCLWMDR